MRDFHAINGDMNMIQMIFNKKEATNTIYNTYDFFNALYWLSWGLFIASIFVAYVIKSANVDNTIMINSFSWLLISSIVLNLFSWLFNEFLERKYIF